MTKDKQFEALARLEFGCEGVHAGLCYNVVMYSRGYPEFEPFCDCPDYDSHDALQRIIDGLDVRSSLREYWYELMAIMVRDRDGLHVREHEMSLATPAQIREALLRTKGMWEKKS